MFCVDLGLGSTCKYVQTYVLVYVCTHTQHVVRIGMKTVLKFFDFYIILISVLRSLNDCLIYVDLYLNPFLYPLWCISTKICFLPESSECVGRDISWNKF